MKKFRSTSVTISVLTALSALLVPVTAHAGSLLATVDTSAGCIGTINGSSSVTINVTAGDNVNVTVNNANLVVSQSISGPDVPAGSVLDANTRTAAHNSQTIVFGVVNSPVTINFTPIPSSDSGKGAVNNCPTGSTPVASTYTINPVAPAPTSPAPTSTSSTSSGSTKKTATTSTTPAVANSATTSQATTSSPKPGTSNSAPKTVVTTKKDNVPPVAKGIILVLIVLAVGILTASLLGLAPYRRAWAKLTGKKPVRKTTRRKRSRRR